MSNICTLTRPPDTVALQGGVSHAQAMKMFERWSELEAVPTIAHRMCIPYEVVCDVLAGKHWPGARQFWMDVWFP